MSKYLDIELTGTIVEYEDKTSKSESKLDAVVKNKFSKKGSYSRPIQGKSAHLIKIDRS